MPLPDIFRDFKLDAWYKIFAVAGLLLLVLGFTSKIYVITNQQFILFSAGILFIGLGKWKNHKRVPYIPDNDIESDAIIIATVRKREPEVIGYILDFLGFGLWLVSVLDFFGVI